MVLIGREYAHLNVAQRPIFTHLSCYYESENLQTWDPQINVLPISTSVGFESSKPDECVTLRSQRPLCYNQDYHNKIQLMFSNIGFLSEKKYIISQTYVEAGRFHNKGC